MSSQPVCFPSEIPIPVPDFGFGVPEAGVGDAASRGWSPPLDGHPLGVISPAELARWLTEPSSHNFEFIAVVDARFDYEYRGGRILGARSVTTRKRLSGLFNHLKGKNVGVIFHCEYSHNRGPRAMAIWRELDRSQNTYPDLSFPHIYLLAGGYKEFWEKYPDLCSGGYVSMRDSHYLESGELRRSHTEYQRDMAVHLSVGHKRLTRAASAGSFDLFDTTECDSALVEPSLVLSRTFGSQ
jgi:M-phase inducer tyrosine phosphatase